MYGHAMYLLARCACGAVASFKHDDTGTPCCRTCYTNQSQEDKP